MKRFLAFLAMSALVAGCGKSAPTTIDATNTPFLTGQAQVDAMAVDNQNGEFYFADRTSGDIFELSPPYTGGRTKVAHVDVSTDGQRGLLGLTVDRNHQVFVGYTAAADTQNVTVAQLAQGILTVIWNGPPSATLANGGRLAFSPNGRLTIGIGDLTDRSKLTDPTSPNGKMLSLDPNGSATQTPTVLSAGWNNPFAFTYAPNGALWVGDNEPGNASERLGRADIDKKPTHITHIGAHQVASGLAATSDGVLWECTYLGHSLQGYKVDSKGVPQRYGKPVSTDCQLGVVALNGLNLVYSTGSELREIQLHPTP